MIIGTIIYTLLGTLLQLLDAATVWIANKILDDTITVFSANQNIFNTFVDLIPFASTIHLNSIIKGISYGIVFLLMVISILKSIASPFTGDDAVNPAQAGIRAAVAIILIIAIFGAGFGFSGTNNVYYAGLLDPIGKWFGTVLSKVGAVPLRGLESVFRFNLNPIEYIAGILLELALLTSIVGAALQYVERIVSFAIYMIFGPIAVAMYASKDTSSVCKTWLMGVFSEFLSIIVSLIMWISFTESAKSGDESLLHYAIMIAILGVMRNSEKIINAFGFQTIRLGDSARAMVAGIGMATSGFMIANSTYRFATTAGKNFMNSNSGKPIGTVDPINGKGEFGNPVSTFFGQAAQVAMAPTPMTSYNAYKNARSQSQAMTAVRTAMANNQPINAQTLNTAMGLSSNSNIHAIGGGAAGDTMFAATATTADGKTINGFVGDAAVNRGGQVETIKNAFFPIDQGPDALAEGDKIVFGDSGIERFVSNESIMMNNGTGSSVYKTFYDSSLTGDNNIPDPSETKAPDNSDAQLPPTNRGPVVDEKEYSPKNV